jgi:serpin B
VEQKGGENLLFSPASLVGAMSMLLPAAHGRTLEQMLATMQLPSDVAEVLRQFKTLNAPAPAGAPYTLENANAMWNDPSLALEAGYRAAIQEAFDATVDEMDLQDRQAATKAINEWAAAHTAGMIDKVVTPDFFTESMLFVLANALYFKGKWAQPFDPKETHDQIFTLADGSTVLVPMMTTGGEFQFHSGQGFDMIVLPYEGERFSMVVLLPAQADQLDELAQVVTPKLLDEWVTASKSESFYGRLHFPKFTLSATVDPIEILNSMGMSDLFTSDADLSGMSAVGGLQVEKFVHAARVEVSEEGTRAAGVSVIGGGACSGPPSFTVDHPFLFAIRDDQSGAIQFLGQVTNPS